jgi:hypothetical protein
MKSLKQRKGVSDEDEEFLKKLLDQEEPFQDHQKGCIFITHCSSLPLLSDLYLKVWLFIRVIFNFSQLPDKI